MNTSSIFLFVLFLYFFQPTVDTAKNSVTLYHLRADLQSYYEVPPPELSAHSGNGLFHYDSSQKILTYEINHTIFDAISAKIYGPAPVGQNGPVVMDLKEIQSPIKGERRLDQSQETSLLKSLYYISIDSPQYPNGDIRGQIVLAKSQFTAILDGKQQLPPVEDTYARGTASITYDQETMTLSYTINHNVSEATAAHIHGPATSKENANATVALERALSPITGKIVFNRSDEEYLFEEKLYVNIHSKPYPDGEIRGQIIQKSVDDMEGDSDGPSTGHTILIILGVVVLIVFVVGGVILFLRIKKNRQAQVGSGRDYTAYKESLINE